MTGALAAAAEQLYRGLGVAIVETALDRPETLRLLDRLAELTPRDRRILLLQLAAAEPMILSDALSALEVQPCLECTHERHKGRDCITGYTDPVSGGQRICFCTGDLAVVAAFAFEDHVGDALAIVAPAREGSGR